MRLDMAVVLTLPTEVQFDAPRFDAVRRGGEDGKIIISIRQSEAEAETAVGPKLDLASADGDGGV
jgi:hypothetical protein